MAFYNFPINKIKQAILFAMIAAFGFSLQDTAIKALTIQRLDLATNVYSVIDRCFCFRSLGTLC